MPCGSRQRTRSGCGGFDPSECVCQISKRQWQWQNRVEALHLGPLMILVARKVRQQHSRQRFAFVDLRRLLPAVDDTKKRHLCELRFCIAPNCVEPDQAQHVANRIKTRLATCINGGNATLYSS